MGDLNITFFVQLINFFVAWWALDTFFFRPCVMQVELENAEKKQKQKAVIQEMLALQKVRMERDRIFFLSREQFLQALPKNIIAQEIKVSTNQFIHVQECDVSTQAIFTKDLVGHLVERIIHG